MRFPDINNKYRIVAVVTAFGLLSWFIQVALDWLIIGEKPFLDLLILEVSGQELHNRISIFANFVFFGVLMLAIFAKFRHDEGTLKEDEKSYRDLVSAAFDSVLIHENGLILHANPALEKMTGYSLSDVLGKSVLDLVADESRNLIIAAMRSNNTKPIEVAVNCKDGGVIWIEAIGEKINYKGRKARIIVIRNISERKQAEKDLIDSKSRYEELFNSAMDGFGLVDQNEIIQFCNPAFVKIFDMDNVNEMIGENIIDFIPANQKDFTLFQTRIREGGKASQYELEILTKKGNTKFILISVSPRFDENGKYIGAFADAVDITSRTRAEEALRESEEQFRAVWENSPIGICLTDKDGLYHYVNPTYCNIYGYSKAELLGKPFYDVIKSAENARDRKIRNAKRFKEGKPVQLGEIEFLTAKGEPVSIQYTADFIRQDNLPKYLVSMNIDVTDLKKLEAQLLQSQKMESIGRLAGGVARDFNNLLTVIMGHAELIITRANPEDAFCKDALEIQAASERAAGLTKQLLAFSRKQTLTLKTVNLNHIIENMKNMLRRIIGEDINFRTATLSSLWSVKVDQGLIEQVITNLAVNARDAMPQGGVLTIETKNVELDDEYIRTHPEIEPGRYIKLSISDTGCGISREIRSKIFEPFFTTKELGKGTGLGLSTVYGIIKQSGGHISVYSEQDHGTVFDIFLPVVEGKTEAIDSERKPVDNLEGNETILIVEDDDNVRNLAIRILERKGYTIIKAVNGLDAFLKCERMEKPVDLVVTDMVMPDMGGIELTE